MITFGRTDNSVLGRWWWTVDRWLLSAIIMLMAAGVLFAMAASPPKAIGLGLPAFHFVLRQLYFIPIALALLVGFSLLTPVMTRRVAILLFGVFYLCTLSTLVLAPEIKGSQRWLFLGGMAVQPSEFLKPMFIVTSAWMFAQSKRNEDFPGSAIAVLLCCVVMGTLLLQPDFGQAILMFTVWGAQFFLAGLPLFMIGVLAIAGVAAVIGAYLLLPHVASRIDRFLDPASGDTYQVSTAMDAFTAGGFLGRGPGEGVVKRILPDAHTDFIFAVIGEEFGLIACLIIVMVFAFVVLRGFLKVMREEDPFLFLASAGLIVLFGMQAIINISVNIQLMPAKGMTLPFVSYGGSSLLSMAMTMGMLLCFTRRNHFGTGGRLSI
ncbi:putative peptidoglycan glycosyltransferase FtsW [Emcibacter sp. SYSU 3D8]|uniref:FtsW/RodA/SpoVE family cell cycle protein n=1 Tax=Emcibacter sp. SYSU 3D8 TaxID=3133969 RepID=UPI0031FE7870